MALPLTTARGQGTSTILSSNPVYADIDRLSELGLLDSTIVGQRPYSVREIARIARVARARLQENALSTSPTDSAVLANVSRLVDDLAIVNRVEAASRALDAGVGLSSLAGGWSLVANSTNADRRTFSKPNDKPAEATIDPLAERRLGTPAARGQVVSVEAEQRLEPTTWAAFQARERIDYGSQIANGASGTAAELLIAAARLRYRNVAFSAGRQQFTWAQSAGDGLFLASDAPALDQLSLTSDHPFILPGLLRFAGPTEATLVIADLGPSVIRSHSKLLTYKVSVQPTNAVELGGTFMDHYGGEGGRPSSLANHVIDFLPFIDVFRTHNYYDTTKTLDVDSDKLLGVDGRIRLDRMGGVLLTGEMLIDDFDPRRLSALLTNDGSQTAAIIIPQIGNPGLSLKLSAKHMGILTYTHLRIANGITTRGRLLGDELGPDAKSYSATLRVDRSTTLHLEIEGRSSLYSDADYNARYTDPAQTIWVISKTASRPDELRDMAIARLLIRMPRDFDLTARGGLERTRNIYSVGGRRTDYVLGVALRVGM